jgi:hypothetical protein
LRPRLIRYAWLLSLTLLLSSPGQVVHATTKSMSQDLVTLVAIHPATAALDEGDTLTVEVWIEDVVDLYGADVQLQFDPSAFQVQDANASLPGVQITLRSDLLQPGLVIHKEADNLAGTIWYANSQSHPALPVSGSGAIFEFELLALQSGVFALDISSCQLSTKDGEPIAFVAQGAVYRVGYIIFLPFLRM